MDPAASNQGRGRGRRGDLALGIALGIALGLAIIALFVFVYSDDTIDDAQLDPGSPVERPAER